MLTQQSYSVEFGWDNQRNDIVLAKTIVSHEQDGDKECSYGIINVKDASDAHKTAQVLVFENARVLPVPEKPDDKVSKIGVDIENAIAALPGGIGNMPVALELMVVGWMLRIVNIVVNTIVAARFIELYVYNAMASLSIATLCYQELHGIAVNFLKSYLAVALQGAVLYLVIGFYPALAGSLGTGGSITEQAWAMLGQSVILLVAVFMSGKFTKAITNAMT